MGEIKNTLTGSRLSPLKLFFFSWESTIGRVYAAASDQGLCHLTLHKTTDKQFINSMKTLYKKRPSYNEKPFRNLRRELDQYLLGKRPSFSMPLALDQGTPFDKAVWKTLAKIPYGQTRSYQWIALKIGNPLASRATGGACGRNPLPIVIPCHRIISSSGKIGGYSGGLHLKRRFLRLEGLDLPQS